MPDPSENMCDPDHSEGERSWASWTVDERGQELCSQVSRPVSVNRPHLLLSAQCDFG